MSACDCDTSFRQMLDLPESASLNGVLRCHRPLMNSEHLCHQEDEFHDIYFIFDGVLKAYRTSQAGQEQVLRFNYPGELIWTGGKRTVSVVSMGVSRVCSIPWSSLRRLMWEYPDVQVRCWSLLSRLIAEEERFLCVLSHGGSERRLAFLLLQLRDHLYPGGEQPNDFKLPMKRGDIGNYLGLRVETIVRAFRKLERDRMIAVNGREITILNSPGLQSLVSNA